VVLHVGNNLTAARFSGKPFKIKFGKEYFMATKMQNSCFLKEFMWRHENRKNRPFCWVLGAGASRESNVRTGGELARAWLEDLRDREVPPSISVDQWIASANLGIAGLSVANAADHYSEIYNLRFKDDPDDGHAYLEKEMAGAKPSFGYAVLARIMDTTLHKAAITTNFDDLIANAISVFTDTMAHVCFHESLTRYIRVEPRRPFIAKIDRDLFHDAKNTENETKKLEEQWIETLKKIFHRFTPVVIGYAGNDGSLMGFLEKLDPIEGGIFWCYREDSPPSERVQAVVARHHGWIIPIKGFDAIMTQLGNLLGCTPTGGDLKATFDKRLNELLKKFGDLQKEQTVPTDAAPASEALKLAREAVQSVGERMKKEKNWWAWQLKADAEPDPVKAEAIYREGLKDFPESAELTGNFAVFMSEVRKNYNEAEILFRKALELDPKNATSTGNFALFMTNVRKDYDEAERLYRKALELDPKDGDITGNFANFMTDVRKDYGEAERLYRKALELDPKHAGITCNFALFMTNVRKDYDEAERLYRKALEFDPKNAGITGNFGNFMNTVRKDYDEAERLYRKALELEPKHATNTGSFAVFMENVRKNYDEAERLYRKALELDPKDGDTTGNFGDFMQNVRKDYDEAERLYRKALELEPNSAKLMNCLAWFLAEIHENYAEAEPLAREAVKLAHDNGGIADTLAYILWKSGKDFAAANQLFKRAVELEPKEESIQKHYADFLKEHPKFGE
jgi:Tfp pilus assembly protein PilF